MRVVADAIAEVHQQRSTKCSVPEETDVIAQKVKRLTIQSVIISQTLFKQAQDVVMRAITDAIAEVHQQRSTKCSAPEESDVIAQKV